VTGEPNARKRKAFASLSVRFCYEDSPELHQRFAVESREGPALCRVASQDVFASARLMRSKVLFYSRIERMTLQFSYWPQARAYLYVCRAVHQVRIKS